MLSHFSHVQLFVTLWIVASQLFCPWDPLGKNTGVGCHALLKGIFLMQGSNPCLLCLLHWKVSSSVALIVVLTPTQDPMTFPS